VLGDLLGRGGMAEVFAGHALGDHGFQKPVAIKRLLPELANDKVFVERLIGEAKLLVGMQHGNSVSVLDLARDGDDVFLVMEFVDGPSLRQLLKARGARGLPLGVVSYIVQSAAAGLEFAHGRPGGAIVHADISPSNLLLTTSGEVRVADFGIARREGGGHGIVEGKWAYMAPEQARGEPLAPRSDVFALGVVLYELITGSHPFGRQVTADQREAEAMRVIPPRVVKPSIPHGLDAICMRALAHDPHDRYARAQQMIDAIVEERFANQWREGASDLAQAIREVSPEGIAQGPRTMVTDRPVTIVTKSLLRELTPHGRRSSGRIPTETSTPAPVGDSGQPTAETSIPPHAPALPPNLFEIPPVLRADGTPMPPFRLSAQVVPGEDLASVHGGTMATAAHVAANESPRSSRLAIIILGLAAVVGVIAAVVLQLGPDRMADAKPALATPAAGVSNAAPSFPPQEPAPLPPPPEVVKPTIPDPAPTVAAQEPTPKAQDVVTPQAEDKPAALPIETKPEARPARARPVGAQPSKKKDPGVLRVNAVPWGWVSIDGGARKDAPQNYSLSPGRHTVKIFNEDGAVKVVGITMESGQVKKIIANLDDGSVQESR
jgi:serine/threonine protein kinase